MYPEITARTLAPRIDVTHRDDPGQSGVQGASASDVTRGGGMGREAVARILAEPSTREDTVSAEIDRAAERLHRALDRRRRIERERRGL